MFIDTYEADIIEEAIIILDTLYEAGDPCELPPSIYAQIKKLNGFNTLSSPVTDPQYDLLRQRLKAIHPDSSIFSQVTASTVSRNVPKVRHSPPMTSISKANGPTRVDVLKKFLAECASKLGYKSATAADGSPYFVQSWKRDGVACAIYYEKGILVRAGLRPRNGVDGDDITDNVKLCQNVPLKLKQPITCSLRGELECHISTFEALNKEMEAKGKKTYANPRNYTAGTMQLDTPDPKRHGGIHFTCYAIEGYDAATYKTARERAMWSNKHLGVEFVRVEPFDFASLQKMEAMVADLDYEVDGVVIEVNNLDDAEQMGREGDRDTGNPNWKIAWKFNEQMARPTIKNIRWQTGRTRKITPVAEFDAVKLAGTNVTNVTLHNVNRVIAMKLGVGAVIEIYKSGKIIPYLHQVLTTAKAVKYPDACPECGAKTAIEGEELVCQNINCVAAASGTFVHYLATFGAKGVAESVVNKMLAAGLLKKYADFYTVTPEQLQKAGLSVREAILAWANIHMVPAPEQEKDNGKLIIETKKAANKKKKVSLGVLLASFGMPGAGKGTGKDLAAHFGTIDKILDATEQDLLGVPNVGGTTAENVYKYLKTNRSAIEALLECVEPEKPKTGKFSGKTFVFTGAPPEGKDYWKNLVENEGGKISSSVSKKTDYVVYGADAGQKLDKAKELAGEGIPIKIIDTQDLKTLLGLKDDRLF